MGIGITASDVEVHHFLERLPAAVVKVRGGLCNVAQRGSLECRGVARGVRDYKTSGICDLVFGGTDTNVVELVVRKEGVMLVDRVAGFAVALLSVLKYLETALDGVSHGFLVVSVVPAV